MARRAVLQLLAATALGGCRGGCGASVAGEEQRDDPAPAAHAAFVASVHEAWEKTGALPRISRIDTARGNVEVFRELAEADRIDALALTGDTLWAAGGGMTRILRLDSKTLATRSDVAVERAAALATCAGKLYAASVRVTKKVRLERRAGDTTLVEVDAARGTVARSLALPGVIVGSLAATPKTIWALSAFDAPPAVALEIDRGRLEISHRHDIGAAFDDLALGPMDATLGDGALWFGAGRLRRGKVVPFLLSLRAGSTRPEALQVDLSATDASEHWLMRLTWGFGRIWATGEKHQPAIAIDTKSGRAVQVKDVPFGTERASPLAANGDGVWMASPDDDGVLAIDPGLRRAARTIAIPSPAVIVAG